MKKNKINKSFILISFICIILIITIIITISLFKYDALTNNLSKGLPVKILFSFISGDQLQFMELFIYSPVTKKAGIYFLPGNIGSRLASLDRVDAINALYQKKDINPLRKKVEEITATEIEFYITFRQENLGDLVDLVEGLEFFISNPVDLTSGGKQILIPSGNILLDGDKALDYLFYVDPNEESREQVWRKQKFLQALLKGFGEEKINRDLLSPAGFTQLLASMDTNISADGIRSFTHEMTEFDAEHIIFQRVEGKVSKIENKDLLIPYFEGNLIRQSISQIFDTINSDEVFDEDALSITLEILNGTAKNGLAANTASLFEQLGYDVINIANAETHEYTKTLVIDRQGRLNMAEEIAKIIQCRNIQTQTGDNHEQQPQVTIILGEDFDGRYCKNE